MKGKGLQRYVVGVGYLDFLSFIISLFFLTSLGDGLKKPLSPKQPINQRVRVVRRCWVNYQCRGVLLILNYSRSRAYCACSRCGWGCLDIFTLIYQFSDLSPSLWETALYRLKYCLKGPLNPKQPTNQPLFLFSFSRLCKTVSKSR